MSKIKSYSAHIGIQTILRVPYSSRKKWNPYIKDLFAVRGPFPTVNSHFLRNQASNSMHQNDMEHIFFLYGNAKNVPLRWYFQYPHNLSVLFYLWKGILNLIAMQTFTRYLSVQAINRCECNRLPGQYSASSFPLFSACLGTVSWPTYKNCFSTRNIEKKVMQIFVK